jgi:hypothetical protein
MKAEGTVGAPTCYAVKPNTCFLAASQGHLLKREDTEAFSSLLKVLKLYVKTVGTRPNLRPQLWL